MQTLTYGRKRPANGDSGSTVFDALADNITLDDAHDHDGTDSQRITSSNLTRATISVTGTGWSAEAHGTYSKTVTLTGAYTWGACSIQVFCSGGDDDGVQIHPKMVKLTSTTFDVYLLVDDQALSVVVT